MNENLRQTSCTPGANLTPNPLSEVNEARPDGEPPTLVSKTVVRRVEGKHGNVGGTRSVANETSSGMAIETEHEEEREVVRIPEGLEALVADLVVRRGIHEEHNQEHKMAGDASCLLVVNVQGEDRTDLCQQVSTINSCSYMSY